MNTSLVPLPRAFLLPGRGPGYAVGLAQYLAGWKALKALPAGVIVEGFQWFSQSRECVLAEISRGVHDRINMRGGLVLPALTVERERRYAARIRAKLAETVSCECRWCGSALVEYQRKELRFCPGTGRGSCRASYFS